MPPWDGIAAEYRNYLSKVGITADQFNDPSFDKYKAFHNFHAFAGQLQQQQQQQPEAKEKETTPGSQANPSRAALENLVHQIEETKYPVQCCGVEVAGGVSLTNLLRGASAITSEKGLILLSLGDSIIGVEEGTLQDATNATKKQKTAVAAEESSAMDEVDFLILQQQKEETFQKGHFTEYFCNVEELKAMDLSDASIVPFFKPATMLVPSGQVVSLLSGKPDGTSKVAPMDIELKSDEIVSDDLAKVDWEVLSQAVERVTMKMRNQGYLSKAFSFAVSNRSAWYLWTSRQDLEGAGTPTLHLHRVTHGLVRKIWLYITQKASQEPGFFLSKDGAAICTCLSKIGLTPGACHVKLLSFSQSFVYGVTVPRYYEVSRGRTAANELGVNVSLGRITYAIKVIRSTLSYNRESEALRDIARGAGSEFYALGCAPCGAGPVQVFLHKALDDVGEVLPYDGDFGWWNTIVAPVDGGVILMKHGDTTAKDAFAEDAALPLDVKKDLLNSLRHAHSAKVLHCDLRRENFVRFGGSWQVIDYGESVREGSTENYDLTAGWQADRAGPRVRMMFLTKAEFQWHVADDYEMLINND